MSEAVVKSKSGTGRPAWGLAVGALVVCEVLMVALAFGWVAIYSYFIHTGEDAGFYEAYAQVASPWVALLSGIPILWMAGRVIGRRLDEARARSTALAVMALWVTMEVVVLSIAAVDWSSMWVMWTANLVTKTIAIMVGVRLTASRVG